MTGGVIACSLGDVDARLASSGRPSRLNGGDCTGGAGLRIAIRTCLSCTGAVFIMISMSGR